MLMGDVFEVPRTFPDFETFSDFLGVEDRWISLIFEFENLLCSKYYSDAFFGFYAKIHA